MINTSKRMVVSKNKSDKKNSGTTTDLEVDDISLVFIFKAISK